MNFCFDRTIQQRVMLGEGGRIILEGVITDRYHDIGMTVVVDADDLVIRSLSAEFRNAPEPLCDRAASRLDGLVGTAIGKGMAKRVGDALGGGEGCGNLKTLLLSLLPLAINARAARECGSEMEMLERMHDALAGTCVGYPVTGGSRDREPHRGGGV
ncbi:MAG: hypothetical protein Fur0034_05240 [Desulfuromonadia bacterium]